MSHTTKSTKPCPKVHQLSNDIMWLTMLWFHFLYVYLFMIHAYLSYVLSDISYNKEIGFIWIYLQFGRRPIFQNLPSLFIRRNRIPSRRLLCLQRTSCKLLIDPSPIPSLLRKEPHDRLVQNGNQTTRARPRRQTRGGDLHHLVFRVRDNLKTQGA